MNISLASDGGFAVRHVAQEEIRLGETRYGLPSSDADLRDEVAMRVLPEMVKQQNNWKSGAILAFEWADAYMAERSRRREVR